MTTGTRSNSCFTGAGMEKKSRTLVVDLAKDDWSAAASSVLSLGGIEMCSLQIL